MIDKQGVGQTRLLVIGLDSATFTVIRPLLAKNKLPNLQKLIASGCSGVLRSSIPPLSPAAWVSTLTGMNPGGHGVFDFRVFDFSRPYGRSDKMVYSSKFAGLTIFDFLSKQGLKVGSFNIPLTYPAWPVNGLMVSGPVTPDLSKAYTYPSDIAAEIGPMARHSLVDELKQADLDAYLDELIWITRKHFEYGQLLLREYGIFDLFWFHLHTIDSVQHRFWQYADFGPGHANSDRIYKNAIETIYILADKGVGELLQLIGPQSNVIIMSDHGARQVGSIGLRPNVWLKQRPYLNLDQLAKFNRYRHAFRNSMGKLFKKPNSKPKPIAGNGQWQAFFFALADPIGCIVIKGDDGDTSASSRIDAYNAVRDAIIHDLTCWENPSNHARVVSRVWKREELYTGKYVDRAPDILFAVQSEYSLSGDYNGQIFTPSPPIKEGAWSGVHDMEGILVANGPSIATQAKINQASLVDIAPTLLTLLAQPIPSNMLGRVLKEIISEHYLQHHKIGNTQPLEAFASTMPDTPDQVIETEAMIKHLQALGYME
jgi:predicted AlkP superfamily phosphohydrolase/phosphomutase